MTAPVRRDLLAEFGEIDIYLFDQLLKGRFDRRRRILDAGCGDGRNLHYLLRRGFDCYGVDQDPIAIRLARRRAASLGRTVDRFVCASIGRLPLPDAGIEAVICSAVLHFAESLDEWDAMVGEMWRVLAPGGLFFTRLASNIGLALAGNAPGRLRLPDGSTRFVVTESLLLEYTTQLGGTLLDPLKTTNVQGIRAMTTWVMEKG